MLKYFLVAQLAKCQSLQDSLDRQFKFLITTNLILPSTNIKKLFTLDRLILDSLDCLMLGVIIIIGQRKLSVRLGIRRLLRKMILRRGWLSGRTTMEIKVKKGICQWMISKKTKKILQIILIKIPENNHLIMKNKLKISTRKMFY